MSPGQGIESAVKGFSKPRHIRIVLQREMREGSNSCKNILGAMMQFANHQFLQQARTAALERKADEFSHRLNQDLIKVSSFRGSRKHSMKVPSGAPLVSRTGCERHD